jgi:hypothetical protein
MLDFLGEGAAAERIRADCADVDVAGTVAIGDLVATRVSR